ncbi:Modification methylase DpnIIB [Anatilimnocola aggregata]|uniref:Modification methylase DpnIIB n=1 Tax=Anatilimnocola aggregata TaxID=2528021 RepID=A0A517Y6L2_9BACT|nr:DNA methyltransferase [Anatilimnocola aggregata]QDU25877.1 Modification methylase DpnIIB [Anatilimnocola aggregata]
MTLNKYDSHAAADIFPLAQGLELDALAADIKTNGQHHPIILHEGKILDGRRRYLACLTAEIEPKILAWDGKGSPLDYVISMNVHRRHLTKSQLAVVALRALPLLAVAAKERQRQSSGRGKKGAQECAGMKGKATEFAAKLVDCCPRLVEQAKSIQASRPDLIPQVESGELTISEAYAEFRGVVPSKCHEDLQVSRARSLANIGDKSNRKANDAYYTPLHAIDSLFAREAFHGLTVEPACGDGRIVGRLQAIGCEAFGIDITQGVDFLTHSFVDFVTQNFGEREITNFATNPPWGKKTEFIERALSLAKCKVAMLLPLTGLTSIERIEHLSNPEFPLKCLYIFRKAVQFDEGRTDNGNGMLYCAWFVWERGYVGKPFIDWIAPEEEATPLPPSGVEPALPPPHTRPLRIAAHPDGFRPKVEYHCGDSKQVLGNLPADSIDCCVTSVPYYLLRDYGCEGQIGLEPSVGDWVSNLLNVFREVRRVLHDKGTCWINVGDPYAYGTGSFNSHGRDKHWTPGIAEARLQMARNRPVHPKSLMFAPHRLTVALAEDGWIGRAEVILLKQAVDGCKDRPIRTHEYLYLFTKTTDYYFDTDSLRVAYSSKTSERGYSASPRRRKSESRKPEYELHPLGKLRGSVWPAGPASGAGDHPAPMPLQVAVDCVRAGCPEGGTVLDPFVGSGTTAVACVENARHCIGIDLNRDYLDIAMKRVPGAKIA